MKLQQSLCLTTALLFLAATGQTARAGEATINPTGTWQWVAPANPDGQIPKITFTLKLQGQTLTGTRMSGSTTTVLTNGVINGDEVSFQTPRHETSFPKGKIAYTTYSGKLSGDTIKGTEEITVDEKAFSSRNWEVKRVKK
ncbi:MAG: hypothetical protein ABSA45_02160 [Verrucomicrobiota bacterium]|jgi:hypothetical protein